jgi:uncharacterized protein with HEPN domain
VQRGPLSEGLVLHAVPVRLIDFGDAVKDATPSWSDSRSRPLRQVAAMRDQLAHCSCNTPHAIVEQTVGPDLVELATVTKSMPAVVDAQR